MRGTLNKRQSVVDLELPQDYSQEDRAYQDWVNLLIDSIFNVLGNDYCVVSWVRDYPFINIRSG
ncbi:MAG TPA: hypothetical protein ENG82_02960 [Bacteroidetes bacterium]|nr:hypothetical protein [Bacteroidota bacterium]